VRPSLFDDAPYVQTNVVGTVALLHAMRDRGVRRMAFASSSSVYGARRGVAFREDDAADQPASPYAASKRSGELFCAAAAASWGLNVACVRLFTVYGPRQRPEMAFSRFLQQMRSGQPVTVYGDGASARDYTYVSDAVAGLIAAHDAAVGARIVNIAGGAVTPLIEAVRLLAAALGVEPRIEHLPDQPGDVPETRADLQVASRWLGWSPRVGMAEGLRRFAESPDA
jgi:UDP-glucuronate 4-epimerase